MVSLKSLQIQPIPLQDLMDEKGETLVRQVNTTGVYYRVAQNYMTRLKKSDLTSRATVAKLAQAASMKAEEFVHRFAAVAMDEGPSSSVIAKADAFDLKGSMTPPASNPNRHGHSHSVGSSSAAADGKSGAAASSSSSSSAGAGSFTAPVVTPLALKPPTHGGALHRGSGSGAPAGTHGIHHASSAAAAAAFASFATPPQGSPTGTPNRGSPVSSARSLGKK